MADLVSSHGLPFDDISPPSTRKKVRLLDPDTSSAPSSSSDDEGPSGSFVLVSDDAAELRDVVAQLQPILQDRRKTQDTLSAWKTEEKQMRNDIRDNNNEERDLQRRLTEVRASGDLKAEDFYNKSFEMGGLEIQDAAQAKTEQRLRKKINKLRSSMGKRADKERKIDEMAKRVIE